MNRSTEKKNRVNLPLTLNTIVERLALGGEVCTRFDVMALVLGWC